MKNFIQPGEVLTVTAPYAVDAGMGVLVGSLFGVCANDADTNDDVELVTEGVFYMLKAGSQAWTQGVRLYWDDSARDVTTSSSSNKLIGVAARAAGSSDTHGYVMLTGAFTQ